MTEDKRNQAHLLIERSIKLESILFVVGCSLIASGLGALMVLICYITN